jgi:SOUL heme-binding protein
MTRFQIGLLAALALGAAALAITQTAAADTPEPTYTLVQRDGVFGVRDYAPHVVAEVLVPAGRGTGMNEGFRPLANYIFGNNRMATGAAREIAMTAAVTGQNVSREIGMTAPVTGQSGVNGQSRIRFIMPAGETLETLPRPNNPAVTLIAEPARRYAVVRFSGTGGADVIARQTAALRAFLIRQNLTPVGDVITAFYDPPWTLPFNRRNEVWIEVAAPAA